MDQRASRHRIPIAEWIVGIIGTVLLVAVLGFLIHEATQDTLLPPDIVTAVDSVSAGRGGWLVHVSARNLGDVAAADVGFRAALARTIGDSLYRDGRLDYLPGHSLRQLSFVFPVEPRNGSVVIEVMAHQTP